MRGYLGVRMLDVTPQTAAAIDDQGRAGAVVVAAPPRGTTRDPETGQLVGGRVYGPWLKAQALRAVGQAARAVDIPVIGCGGIHAADDARDFIDAGARAVQVDTVTWVQPRMLEVIARNLTAASSYTLTCTEPTTNTVFPSVSATVEVIPEFQET